MANNKKLLIGAGIGCGLLAILGVIIAAVAGYGIYSFNKKDPKKVLEVFEEDAIFTLGSNMGAGGGEVTYERWFFNENKIGYYVYLVDDSGDFGLSRSEDKDITNDFEYFIDKRTQSIEFNNYVISFDFNNQSYKLYDASTETLCDSRDTDGGMPLELMNADWVKLRKLFYL